MAMDVVEQIRQLTAAFDEFVVDVGVDEVIARGEGTAPTGDPGWNQSRREVIDNGSPRTRLGLVAAAVLLVGGLVGALTWIGRGGSDSTDSTTPMADVVESPATTPASDGSAAELASPLTAMRSRLTNQADTELFVVQATAGSYWRLATLAEFDGTTWGFPQTPLTQPGSPIGDGRDLEEIRQEVRIVNLGGTLVPAAADVIQASGDDGLRWASESQTLVKIDRDLVAGDVFEIVSASPRSELEDLQAATSTEPGDPIYLEVPDDVPAPVGEQARQVTAGATTPFETARALQGWFQREFTYSLEVQPGHGNSAMESFLRDRIGYSEQFAGTYAVMMRSLGIPTRVAVGFTSGVDEGDQSYAVFGKNAHAWPEVWFDGLGWVPFEPTPGRGAPGAGN